MGSGSDSVQDRITGFWSSVASGYEAHEGNVPARDSAEYAAWGDAIRSLLPGPPADVLDMATGTGFVALIAAALGHRVTGLDGSGAMLAEAREEAQRRALEIAFLEGDGVEPDFPPSSFDAIISRHFIWTLREPERAFGNWLTVLRPGGRMVAIDGFWFTQPGGDDAPGPFEQHYTPETRAALPAMQLSSPEPIAAMVAAAGFVEVTIGELADVHAVAVAPPSAEPWYVITAYRAG